MSVIGKQNELDLINLSTIFNFNNSLLKLVTSAKPSINKKKKKSKSIKTDCNVILVIRGRPI